MSNTVLAAKGVSKYYKNGTKEVRAVDSVDLNIFSGTLTAIVGPSGAGKSTLLHILGALDRPSGGSVMLGELDIARSSDMERAGIRNKNFGFIFQFYHLLPEFNALENVALPSMIRGRPDFIRAEELLKMVGLKDRMNHKPGELSGGESQRVAIARALINSPDILLCDEPTGNLDSVTSGHIYGILSDIKIRYNTALVMVTHDNDLAAKSDYVVRLKDGRRIG